MQETVNKGVQLPVGEPQEQLQEEDMRKLMEVEAYRDAFHTNPKNPTHLTKSEKKQLDAYQKQPVNRAEFNETVYSIGSDFGKLLLTVLAVEAYIIDTIGREKYAEYRNKAMAQMQGLDAETETESNDSTTSTNE